MTRLGWPARRVAVVSIMALGAVSSLRAAENRAVDSSISATAVAAEVSRSMARGPFKPTLDSLAQSQTPEWFRDAKFGIWSHWGPQSVPRQGDWYARHMYMPGHRQYEHHLKTYGHPSKHGYKDIIPLWKAEKFEPERLMALYQKAGARYFVSMGVHHDNFDLWRSRHQAWNATKMGPKRDIVGAWRQAAQKHGLRFGVSEHLGASYAWFATSHGADTEGPLAGVPYDGADPKYQSLYHPAHDEPFRGGKTWYAQSPYWQLSWFRRMTDLLQQYQPDFLYTDGGIPFGDTGRSLIAHFYNDNAARHGGKLDAVYTCKLIGSGEFQPGSCLQDVERGGMPGLSPRPWQTDTSVGDWFYNEHWKYRPTAEIVKFFVDIVSKNGNLLLNVVQRPEGDLDPEAERFLADMAAWTAINGEGIFATRPWLTYGEGPTEVGGHFREDFGFSAKDVRYTQSKDGKTLYAFALGWPEGPLTLESILVKQAPETARVQLLGSDAPVPFKVTAKGQLVLDVPELAVAERPGDHAYGFKLTGFSLDAQPEAKLSGTITTIQLTPEAATLEGQQLRVGHIAVGTAIMAWWDPSERIHWLTHIPKPGKQRVAIKVFAPVGASRLTLELAGKSFSFDVPNTSVTKQPVLLEVGEVDIPRAGVQQIVLRAADPQTFNLVDVLKVYLAPEA